MAVLRVLAGSSVGTVYEVSRDVLVVGRDLEATIQVADQGVSRRHAEIVRVGELCLIRDCGSRNGTFINEERVTERVLREGDRIRVGATTFTFEDRPELLDESHLIHFNDAAFSPQETLYMRAGAGALKIDTAVGEHRQSPLLASVDRISQIVAEEKTLSAILRKAAAELGQTIRAGTVYVFSRKRVEERDEYSLIASWSAEKGNGKTPLRVSRTVMAEACREGSAVLVNHAGRDARFSAQDSIVLQGLQSILCAPLKVQTRVLGILYAADCVDQQGFSTENMELFSAVATQLGLAVAFAQGQHRHDAFFRNAMRVLLAAIEYRLPARKGASERIANFCAAIARAMQLEPADVRYAWLSGLLHDVSVLGLSDRELEEQLLLPIRRLRAAEELLSHLAEMGPVLAAVKDQDERYDGGGQPAGKKGDEVPLLAQVLGLAKYFDSLLSGDIVSGSELTVREAVVKVNELKGKQFPARVVNGLLVAYRQGQLFQEEQQFSALAL